MAFTNLIQTTPLNLVNLAYTLAWLFLTLAASFLLLLHRREPAATIAWLLVVLLLPFFGPLLFFLMGPQRLERKALRRRNHLKEVEFFTNETAQPISSSNETETQILKLARQISEYPLARNNSLELLPDPENTLISMQNAILGARKFIHLEYYIFSADEVTEQLFSSLESALDRGVEVRILYDAFGSLFLKRRHFKSLIEKGAKVAGFLPLTFWPQRPYPNFRNHRKILIVDGCLAFTGGTNIGKEYLGLKSARSWRDFSVAVSGPVVNALEDVFAKDWYFTTKEDLLETQYFSSDKPSGSIDVQVLESGPDTSFSAIHNALFLAITGAQKSIHLTTPYFVPDAPMISALTVAALRGIEVKLLLPAKTDARVVQLASRSFYESLLEAGVKIYEYQPTILHSKLLIIDGRFTIVGSANMDIRSFRLNFELNLLVIGKEFCDQVLNLFHTDMKESVEITLAYLKKRSVFKKLLENGCRLLSPIL